MTQKEIERKFILSEHPVELLQGIIPERISQGYLLLEGDRELRIRKRGENYRMTVKQGVGLVRTEHEWPIAVEQFDCLWPLTEGRRVEKLRYAVPWNHWTLEIDLFEGPLSPLMLLEIEFADLQDSRAFTVPDFVVAEVTNDKAYKNAMLATRGLPDAFFALSGANHD